MKDNYLSFLEKEYFANKKNIITFYRHIQIILVILSLVFIASGINELLELILISMNIIAILIIINIDYNEDYICNFDIYNVEELENIIRDNNTNYTKANNKVLRIVTTLLVIEIIVIIIYVFSNYL